MAKNNKILYIAGAVGVGVLAYFGYNWWKKNKSGSQTPPPPPPPQLPTESVNTNQPSTPSSTPSSSVSNPFKTEAELLAFQKYVINTKNDKTILGKGGSTGFGDDGKWGPASSSAWTKYGAEYLTSKGSSSASTPSGLSTEVKNNIDVIIRRGEGDKAKRSYLESTAKKYPAFINNWANAIKNRLNTGGKQGTTFVFANQLYNSFDAKKELSVSPVGKKAILKDNAKNPTVRWYAKWDSPTKPANKDLGKVQGVFYNRNDKALFLFVPNNVQGATHKWTYALNVNLI
jgi:hypothetical protein